MMGKLTDALDRSRVLVSVNASTKEELLGQIAHAIAGSSNIPETDIITALRKRESLGSTGIEAGVAIPHGKLKSLKAPILSIATTAAGIDFGAIDENPSSLFFTILAPATGSTEHLHLLAAISKLIHSEDHMARLRACHTGDEVCRFISDWESAC